eukprot:GHVP01060323.1.p1 GENE.GHVP01060323.1~~GHVP01060323.1.p1  ORF type:complete len:585 (-),score=59.69 GHVP01060323.1:262-2016(-)
MNGLLPTRLKYIMISFPIAAISLSAILIVDAFKSSKTTYHMVQSIVNSPYISLVVSASLVYLAILITIIHIKILPCDILEPERTTIIQELLVLVFDWFVIGTSFRTNIDKPSIFTLSLLGGFKIYSLLYNSRLASTFQTGGTPYLDVLRLQVSNISVIAVVILSFRITIQHIHDNSLYIFVSHKIAFFIFTHARDLIRALNPISLTSRRLRIIDIVRRNVLLILSLINASFCLFHLTAFFYLEVIPFPMIQDCISCIKSIIEDAKGIYRFSNIYSPSRMPGAEATRNDIPNDLMCLICRDNMNEPSACRRLPCGHIFHTNCLQGWLDRQYTCPTCRVDLRASQRRSRSNERTVGTNNFISRIFFNGPPPEVLSVSRLQEITRNIVGITESEAEQPNARNTNVLSMLSSINNQINTLENRFSESMRELRVQLQEVEEELRRIPSETAVITNTNTEEAPQQESRDNNTSDRYNEPSISSLENNTSSTGNILDIDHSDSLESSVIHNGDISTTESMSSLESPTITEVDDSHNPIIEVGAANHTIVQNPKSLEGPTITENNNSEDDINTNISENNEDNTLSNDSEENL